MRDLVLSWLRSGLQAVAPEPLTLGALSGRGGPLRIIAIGKAAPAMCRGVAAAVGAVTGVCVTDHQEDVPSGVELMIGDHPIPGERSLAAGARVLEVAAHADVALISGGGSALCEVPVEGVSLDYVADVTRRLLDGGTDIEEMNLVRGHLSRIKSGGLGPLPTFILSDVSGWGPEVVSSGPTIPTSPDPDRAISILLRLGMDVPDSVEAAVASRQMSDSRPEIEILADGRTAADAMARAAARSGMTARVSEGWIAGPLVEALDAFIDTAGTGVTVAAGEASLEVTGDGAGGRNTHAALWAAARLDGTGALFAALATDGVDGRSGSAGAIVDGTTVSKGGDPTASLARHDSAGYLDAVGSLVRTGPTGTNVADLWLMWKPEG